MTATSTVTPRRIDFDRPQVADRHFVDDELRDMLRWHALEECEHKAVAFDTMQAVDRSEANRIAGVVLFR